MKSFTLIETLVTICIFALIMGALSGVIVTSYRTHSYTQNQATAINEARRGVDVMVREIREARSGDDGSYPIEKAGDKEFAFYSDIDKDGEVELVRYFLGSAGSGSLSHQCVSFAKGGSCDVGFYGFLEGELLSAEVKVSIEGDLGWSHEYAEIYADGEYLGRVCRNGCSDCSGTWQGNSVFDITGLALDDAILFSADSTNYVDPFCDWEEPNHSIKVKFEISWTEEMILQEHEFKKGVTNPVGEPAEYPSDEEEIIVLSSFVRNSPPIFEYFDEDGNKLIESPARLIDTKMMKIYLIVNVDPNRAPQDFGLESYVQLRNLKLEI